MRVGIVRDGISGLCPYAEVSVKGRSGHAVSTTALIDTGFNGYISLPSDLVGSLGLSSSGVHVVELANSAEENVDLFFGEVTLGELVATVPILGIGSEATIGTGLLRSHSLRIDFVGDGEVGLIRIV